ncbi:hypothetical protein G7076_04830 [Sphingomonas sp. HDW15A]|uniref:hypothetical protein n=1 Tax=Sphingomonas sp. HDW15A TaxID=2714942 RepID=UPI00140DF004|nr:hypothetical protein [Sphingomonas sp. HDW15A]QIK95881.1 hypothetical protein G7076_04830 [Sphingomonas sp. HDW15A]
MLLASLSLSLFACNQGNQGSAPATQEQPALEALTGSWIVDLASAKFEGKPNEFIIANGTYDCITCTPPLKVAADGQFHAVADRPYYDSMSVKSVDDRTVEFRRRKGDREVSSTSIQLSPDGNVLTTKFRDATNPDVPAIEGTSTSKRAGPAPAGAHAVSGQWIPDRFQDYSKEALKVTFKIDGDKVTMNSQGSSYIAQLGGPAVPIKGDTGGTMIAVAREGSNGIRETSTRDGKEVNISVIQPSADGKSVTVTSTDPRDGSKTTYTAKKQS